jgi:parallel beta-helix repeat protein
VEGLTVKNITGVKNTQVWLQGAANNWVKNVKLDYCGARCVDIWDDVYRNEIRDSYFTNCYDRVNSDSCYGVSVFSGTGNLVENNIFDNTANGIITVSASGNVFAYNYMYGVHRISTPPTWFWSDTWTHGAHSSYNLWEGNDETALVWDEYWGSNSHNLAFRNRFRGMDATINYDPYLQSVGAILTFPNQNYMTDIGNVLGTASFSNLYEETTYYATTKPIWATYNSAMGITTNKEFTTTLRHMNYDYFTNSVKHCGDPGEPGCQGGDGSTILPASYYLPGKPSWFGSGVWPPIGPDVTGLANAIPAQLCYQNTTAKGIAFNANNCYGSGGDDAIPPSFPRNLRIR